jgi:hypothetical protein
MRLEGVYPWFSGFGNALYTGESVATLC